MSNQLANQRPDPLRDLLKKPSTLEQFALALPEHIKPERFARIAITCLTKTPKLAECTPASFMRCLMDLSALGLEPDGRLAHLIPYKDQCTLVLDYKGLIDLAMRTGRIAKLHAELICQNDDFAYNLGEVTRHQIDFSRERGPMYAVYGMAETKEGARFFAVMQKHEIDAIRKRSRAGGSGPWVTDYNEMARKTVMRRLLKHIPLSAEYQELVSKDDDRFAEIDTTKKPSKPREPADPFSGPPTVEAETVEGDPYAEQDWGEEGSEEPPTD